MGAIASAFTSVFVDGSNVVKASARALGTTIEGYFVAPWTWANPGGTTAALAAPTGYIERLVGKDADTYQGLVVDAYGGIPIVRLRRGNGTAASPTAVVSGNNIGEVEFAGTYNTTTYATISANMRASATENWSSTAWGSQIVFQTTPNTTNTPADAVWIGQDKSLLAGGAIGNQTGVSAGGTVTQATSRTTGVTLNKPTGEIVVFSATSATVAAFTVTNSFVGANDTVIIVPKAGSTNTYQAFITAVASGSFNVSASTLSGAATESYKLQFTVIKGAVS